MLELWRKMVNDIQVTALMLGMGLGPRASRPHDLDRGTLHDHDEHYRKHAGGTPAVPGPFHTPAQVKGWHSRGYLPHFDGAEQTQMVTFRLVASLPRKLI